MNAGLLHNTIKAVVCLMLASAPMWGFAQEDPPASAGEETEVPAPRAVPDSIAERMKREKDFLYANDPSFWKTDTPRNDNALIRLLGFLSQSTAFRWILYVLLAVAVFFLLYQVIIVNRFFVFARDPKKRSGSGDPEDDSEIPDDLDARISSSIASAAYRPAVRYLYLRTLQQLHHNNRIRLTAAATNGEYQQQLRHHPAADAFGRLTRLYEQVWYGGFVPAEPQFNIIKKHFDAFIP